jgi:hypothetical protein
MRDSASDRTGPEAYARDFRKKAQELVERLAGVRQSGSGAANSVAEPLRSFVQAGAAASAAPAKQVQVVIQAVHQQRAQLELLRQQLDLFDQQLQVLERALGPLVAMADQWSVSQEAVLKLLRPAAPSGEGPGKPPESAD